MSNQKSFTISGYMVIEGRKRGSYGGTPWYEGKIEKITKSKPAINNNQIALQINVEVPIAFFERLTPVINIELPSESVVNPDVETVINLTALEVADKLQLDVTDVEDGLRTLIKQKANPIQTVTSSETTS